MTESAGSGLVLPGEITDTALVLPADLSFERWEALGAVLQRIERASRWWVGDWLNFGERTYGETYSQAIEVTGQSYGSLRDCAYVGNAFDVSRRRDTLSWSHHREVAALSVSEQERWLTLAEDNNWSKAELRKALAGGQMGVHYSSDSPEWYTPPHILHGVEAVLGTIDLDPCSNTNAPNVPARRHFVEADDGLAQVWAGRVYMNPPYGDVIGDWIEKLRGEHEAGNVPEGIALIPARTDTGWWQGLRDCAICFVRGRLKFSGHDNSAPFPSAVAYFGPRRDEFAEVFGTIGDVWERRR